jgi:hypothetical protein
MTGKRFETMLNDDIINKLHLKGTSYKEPKNNSRSVIPGSLIESGWNVDLGDEGP